MDLQSAQSNLVNAINNNNDQLVPALLTAKVAESQAAAALAQAKVDTQSAQAAYDQGQESIVQARKQLFDVATNGMNVDTV